MLSELISISPQQKGTSWAITSTMIEHSMKDGTIIDYCKVSADYRIL